MQVNHDIYELQNYRSMLDVGVLSESPARRPDQPGVVPQPAGGGEGAGGGELQGRDGQDLESSPGGPGERAGSYLSAGGRRRR